MNILYIALLLCVVRHVLPSASASVSRKRKALALSQSSREGAVKSDPKAQRPVVELSREQMANALCKIEEQEEFVQTFKRFEKEQNNRSLFCALIDALRVPRHRSKVIACLRMAVDPFPNEASNVSWLVHGTLMQMSWNSNNDTESFANLIAPLKPDDVKPLASFRNCVLKKDALDVLKRVMAASPALITGTLPRWISYHGFDRNSSYYTFDKDARDQAFQYLSSFATESDLNDALSLVMKNEHFKVDSQVRCCYPQDLFPHDLYNKLSTLLKPLKDRRELIEAVLLPLLPKVLVELILDYVHITS